MSNGTFLHLMKFSVMLIVAAVLRVYLKQELLPLNGSQLSQTDKRRDRKENRTATLVKDLKSV